MNVDFSKGKITVVIAPIDLRYGYNRLATVAQCLLNIPIDEGGHFVAFVSRHRKICKVIWCDERGSCMLTRRLNDTRFEQFLVKVSDPQNAMTLTAEDFESFLDGKTLFKRVERRLI